MSSAAWHYARAEELLEESRSSPGPAVKDRLVAEASVHASLAQVGAVILAVDPHSRARSELADCARGVE